MLALKSIGMTIAAFIVVCLLVGVLVSFGLPGALVVPMVWVGLAIYIYSQAKEARLKHPWAWALGGFLFGILALGFFFYSKEKAREAAARASAAAEPAPKPAPASEGAPRTDSSSR